MRPSTLNSNLDDRNSPINGEGGYTFIVSDSGLTAIIPRVFPSVEEPKRWWSFPSWPPTNDMNRELVKRFKEIAPDV